MVGIIYTYQQYVRNTYTVYMQVIYVQLTSVLHMQQLAYCCQGKNSLVVDCLQQLVSYIVHTYLCLMW